MRTLSFVERLELDFNPKFLNTNNHNVQSGQQPFSLYQQAITLGDINGDGSNELAIGTMSGQLLIYKGSEQQPWKSAHDLGMITCVCIGNVCNDKKNYILVLSADGWCNLFLLSTKTNPEGASEVTHGHDLQPVFKQHLHANSKVLMLSDMDGDGALELTIGYSDRVVRTYRWFERKDRKSGEFGFLQKWSLQTQIGSLSMSCDCGSVIHDIIVSQTGASYVTLSLDGQIKQHQSESSTPAKARNDSVFTEIVGNISTMDANHNYRALCTLDGTIMLLDNDGRTKWDIHVDHQLFGLTKLDITGDGAEEVMVCSWDGQTYIVDSHKQIARFQFDEPVAAFLAGRYSVESDRNESCLIYVTFTGKIYIYHNIQLAQVQTTSLIEALSQSSAVKEFLERVNMSDCSREEKIQLYQWCLYGRKPKCIKQVPN